MTNAVHWQSATLQIRDQIEEKLALGGIRGIEIVDVQLRVRQHFMRDTENSFDVVRAGDVEPRTAPEGRNIGSFPATFHTVVPNTTVTAGAWVRLTATIDLVLANTSLILYVESNTGTPSFYIDDFQFTFVPPPVAARDIPSVYEAFAAHFPIGAAVWQGDLTGEHAFLLTKHFNSITSENDMKWSALQNVEGTFTFATADAQVAFAKANNMTVRGHTLVWHQQNPAWLFNDLNGNPMTPTPENKALLLHRMENHIRAVLTHFGDDICSGLEQITRPRGTVKIFCELSLLY
jgi:hypothetical protein